MEAGAIRDPSARPEDAPARAGWLRWVPLIALLAFALLVLRNAWICDDAFFSLRPARHLAEGYGLRHNIAERVQGFTNPLWTLLLAGAYGLGLPYYAATLALGLLASLVAAAAALRATGRGLAVGLLLVGVLAGSKAFVDFSTSGLENPLAHALWALFLVAWLRSGEPRPLLLGMLASALALTRPDLALLVAPVMVGVALGRPRRRTLLWLALGALPLVAWALFALVYYGSPLPCTALVKLGDGGLSRSLLLERGWVYLVDSLRWDRLTLPVILSAVPVVVLIRRRREALVLAGILAYLGYVVVVGGDFMVGRFLTVPLLGAAVLLARGLASRPRLAWVALVLALAASLSSPRSPLRPGSIAPGEVRGSGDMLRFEVADERLFWYEWSALHRKLHGDGLLGIEAEEPVPQATVVITHGGHEAYRGGPLLHAVQLHGLTDPMVALMPVTGVGLPRAGHASRQIPDSYLESIEADANLLQDPSQAALYDDLRLLTRGPLFTRERWAAILRMQRVWLLGSPLRGASQPLRPAHGPPGPPPAERR